MPQKPQVADTHLSSETLGKETGAQVCLYSWLRTLPKSVQSWYSQGWYSQGTLAEGDPILGPEDSELGRGEGLGALPQVSVPLTRTPRSADDSPGADSESFVKVTPQWPLGSWLWLAEAGPRWGTLRHRAHRCRWEA